jgi:hypothetical protein
MAAKKKQPKRSVAEDRASMNEDWLEANPLPKKSPKKKKK